MEIRKGIAVSPGVVISTAVVLDAEDLFIPPRTISATEVPQETARLGGALAQAVVDITRLRDQVSAQAGRETGAIFDFHLGVLRDKSLLQQLNNEIVTNHTTAERAVSVV